MGNPGVTAQAEITYEVTLVEGPRQFTVAGAEFVLESPRDDLAVIVRVTSIGRTRIDQKIVGVIGGDYRQGTSEMLALRAFMVAGGVIGINPVLQ